MINLEILPWSRPARLGYACGLPVDENNETITGITRWFLESVAIEQGYRGSRWLKKGNQGFEFDNQIFYPDLDFIVTKNPDYHLAQSLVTNTKAWIKHAFQPFYWRFEDGTDFIQMPDPSEFESIESYWWTMFHELVHWATYGVNRIAWKGEEEQGEMIAEMGAAILIDYCGIAGIRMTSPHHQKWIYNNDLTYLTHAANVAEESVVFIKKVGFDDQVHLSSHSIGVLPLSSLRDCR